MLSTAAIALAGGVAIIVGVLIGAIGIGGVLLVPMLTYAPWFWHSCGDRYGDVFLPFQRRSRRY